MTPKPCGSTLHRRAARGTGRGRTDGTRARDLTAISILKDERREVAPTSSADIPAPIRDLTADGIVCRVRSSKPTAGCAGYEPAPPMVAGLERADYKVWHIATAPFTDAHFEHLPALVAPVSLQRVRTACSSCGAPFVRQQVDTPPRSNVPRRLNGCRHAHAQKTIPSPQLFLIRLEDRERSGWRIA